MMEEPEQVVTTVSYNPEEDKFLLLKRAESKNYFPGKWEFPGGFRESDNISDEALRELREETGLIGEVIREGDEFFVQTNNGKVEVHPVLTIIDFEEPDLSREHTEFRWVDLDEIEELETVKGLRKDLVNVGVLDE